MKTVIINKNGKKINKRFLPKSFVGDRLPLNYGDTLSKGIAEYKSLWNTYSLDEILNSDLGILSYRFGNLTKLN